MNKMMKFWISVFGVSDAASNKERPQEVNHRITLLESELAEKQAQLEALNQTVGLTEEQAKEKDPLERRIRDIERLIKVYSSVEDF